MERIDLIKKLSYFARDKSISLPKRLLAKTYVRRISKIEENISLGVMTEDEANKIISCATLFCTKL